MQKDLSKYTTEELEEIFQQLQIDIVKMVANPEAIELYANIEKELNLRN